MIVPAPRKDWNPGAVVPEASTRSRRHRHYCRRNSTRRSVQQERLHGSPVRLPEHGIGNPGAVVAHVIDKKTVVTSSAPQILRRPRILMRR
uniref:Transposase n=1 Tax=Steinernema glaseri TaxID=37863 RepID=A0A1I7ZCD1_9BILA